MARRAASLRAGSDRSGRESTQNPGLEPGGGIIVGIGLALTGQVAYGAPRFGDPEEMSNRAIWNVRLRHVWLATPLKGKRLKRRQRLRIGLEDALIRKGKNAAAEPTAPETSS